MLALYIFPMGKNTILNIFCIVKHRGQTQGTGTNTGDGSLFDTGKTQGTVLCLTREVNKHGAHSLRMTYLFFQATPPAFNSLRFLMRSFKKQQGIASYSRHNTLFSIMLYNYMHKMQFHPHIMPVLFSLSACQFNASATTPAPRHHVPAHQIIDCFLFWPYHAIFGSTLQKQFPFLAPKLAFRVHL